MANYNKITESKFSVIKILLNGGASVKEAAKYMGVSDVTVYAIKNAETFVEYKNIAAEKAIARKREIEKNKAQKEQPKAETPVVTDDRQKGGTISANYQINRIYEVLKRLDETMTLVSNKLGFIVDELTK